jgi:hypothetical protein
VKKQKLDESKSTSKQLWAGGRLLQVASLPRTHAF